MRLFIASLCVGFGGSLGALSRYELMDFMQGGGLPGYVSLMVINVSGCFFIGLVFVWLEGSLCRDGTSRLRHLPLSETLRERKWWPDGDPTRPIVDQFRISLNLQVLSSVAITGFLGTFTTFSAFSLLSVQLFQGGAWISVFINMFGSVCLGFLAVWAGLLVGRSYVLR